ncbi:MAG TPA: hypothetical protein VLH61_09585 [Bacteroidales bacterium]|nr:hypothetical protein [Bacteroidales bacterium]
MKTTKSFLKYFAAMLLLLPVLSHSQHGPSVLERLTRNTWVIPNSDLLEITYTDSTTTSTIQVGDSLAHFVAYYYLSDAPDTLFQAHKIGTATNGRFINFILREALRDNQLHTISISKIVELNDNELIFESTRKGPIVGSRTSRFVPKPD